MKYIAKAGALAVAMAIVGPAQAAGHASIEH
jgi:hypothetical protein